MSAAVVRSGRVSNGLTRALGAALFLTTCAGAALADDDQTRRDLMRAGWNGGNSGSNERGGRDNDRGNWDRGGDRGNDRGGDRSGWNNRGYDRGHDRGYDRGHDRSRHRDHDTRVSVNLNFGHNTSWGYSRWDSWRRDDCSPRRPVVIAPCPPPVVIAPCPPPVVVAPCPPKVVVRRDCDDDYIYRRSTVIVDRPVIVERPVVVERQVVVEKPVVVEREVVVEKPVVVERRVVVEEPRVQPEPGRYQDRELGDAYLRVADFDNSARVYRRYLAAWNGDGTATRNLGLALVGRGDVQDGFRAVVQGYRTENALFQRQLRPSDLGGAFGLQRLLDAASRGADGTNTAEGWFTVAVLHSLAGNRDAASTASQRARDAGLDSAMLDQLTLLVARGGTAS